MHYGVSNTAGHEASPFFYEEYKQLERSSPAKLLDSLLQANHKAQETWSLPAILPQAVVLSCSNPEHRLSSLFGGHPILIDHLREPLGAFSNTTKEAMLLAAQAHKVKVMLWIPTLRSWMHKPVEIFNRVTSNDTLSNNFVKQHRLWDDFHDEDEIRAKIEQGELLSAQLDLDQTTQQLKILSVKSGQVSWESKHDLGKKAQNTPLTQFLAIGQSVNNEVKPLSDCSPEEILGALLWKNHLCASPSSTRKVAPLGCFITCMDPRICYFGPNSIFKGIPMLIHNMRVPGASFPPACRDAAIHCATRDKVKILAWVSHDSTCAMAQLCNQGAADHVPLLRDHFKSRQTHWVAIVGHPAIQRKLKAGKLIVVRLDLDLHTAKLRICDLHYDGRDKTLLANWMNT